MEEEGIVVVSCFDGMACARMALDVLGVKVKKYYAFEIDKYAMAVAKANYPDIIHLGDIRNASIKELGEERIDLICGGSPCQGFSFAGKQLAFDDPRSKLFFEFVRLVNECKELNPDVLFLLENVKMKREHELVISKYMGVSPIEINAALVSAQNRKRNFWTNIYNRPIGLFGDMYCDIPQPADKGILLKDILQPENEVDEKYYLSEKYLSYIDKRTDKYAIPNIRDFSGKSSTITVCGEGKNGSDQNLIKYNSGGNHSDMDLICVKNTGTNRVGSIGDGTSQGDRIYSPDGKSTCISAQTGGFGGKTGLYEVKSPCLHGFEHGTNGQLNNQLAEKGMIRRLTPTECCRLQSIPEHIITIMLNCGVSDSQLYKMLGNGWNIEVIVHILSYAPFCKKD
jgi:site-specific DNA-cytosine methylase